LQKANGFRVRPGEGAVVGALGVA